MDNNDIDVFHCDYYSYDKECSAEYSLSCGEIEEFERCEDLPNCYYKQLQRKIKECEELKKSLRWIRDYRIDEIGYYDEEDTIIEEIDEMLEEE